MRIRFFTLLYNILTLNRMRVSFRISLTRSIKASIYIFLFILTRMGIRVLYSAFLFRIKLERTFFLETSTRKFNIKQLLISIFSNTI
jgi:hypothetical protein